MTITLFWGVQEDCLAIALQCASRGHEVHVFCCSWKGEQPDSLQIHILGKLGWSNIARNRHFFRQLEFILPKHRLDGVVAFNRMPNADPYAQRMGWLNQIVGLKYYNVYGPNEAHKGDMRSLVAKAYEQIQETGQLGLFKSYHPDYTDGNQMRDFLYVKDAVAMTLHLANTDTANGLYNLGSGQANTWNTLANAIFSALGKEPNIRYIDMPDALKGKYQYYTCANTDKLRKSGYTNPGYSLEDGVKDYVQNYLVTNQHLGQEY